MLLMILFDYSKKISLVCDSWQSKEKKRKGRLTCRQKKKILENLSFYFVKLEESVRDNCDV